MTIQTGSNLTGTLDQNGGVTSIQFGQPAPLPGSLGAHVGERFKVVGGTTRVSVDGSQDEVSSYSSYNAQDGRNAAEQAAAQGGSIAQTFDRANGGTVMVEGMRTSAANAQRMGLIRMEGGRPFDVSSGKASGPSISPQTKAAEPSIDDLKIAPESTALPPAEHFDSAEWDAYEGDIAPIAQPAFDGAISRGTLAAMNGTSLQDVVSHLSKDENMSPERASMLASSVEGMFKGVVNRAVAAEGITPADLPGFYAYCRDQRNCQEAIAELVSQRKTGLFKRFASEYSARMARYAGVNG